MNTKFDELIFEHLLYLESPEDYMGQGKLTFQSQGVIVFAYFIKENMTIYSTKAGTYHNDMIRPILKNKELNHPFIKVDNYVEDAEFNARNVITGRIWPKEQKISIWEYEKDVFTNNRTPQYIKHVLKKVNAKNLHKYTDFEITYVFDLSKSDIFEL